MSKIGQYIVQNIDLPDLADDEYWQSHEYDEEAAILWENERNPKFTWVDLTTLPPDVKEKLISVGVDEFELNDDLPF